MNPEQGEGALDQVGGTWGTIEFVVPDFLEPTRDAVNAFFTVLINILNILLGILEILKVFVGAFLDPVIALIETLLDLIQQILNDLRNAGLYIHGDFYIVAGPDFKELRGGFQAYEQRMISRFVDRRDPNRPNISNNSTCIAVFLYTGADISNVQRVIRLLQGILQLFNQTPPPIRTVGQVTGLSAKYGLDGASVLTYKEGLFQTFRKPGLPPFNAVNLTWSMAPVPGNFLTNFAQFAPTGFIIDVSTVQAPLELRVDKQVDLNRMELTQAPPKIFTSIAVDSEGVPLQLTGGADQLEVQSNVQFNFNSKSNEAVKDGMVRAYTAKSLASQAPIDLSQLKDGSKYYIQRSFYVPRSQSAFYPGRGYGHTLNFAELPLDADWELDGNGKVKRGADVQPTSYFVRVRAVSKNVTKLDDYRYNIDSTNLDQPSVVIPYVNKDLTPGDFGDVSFPLEISFPNETTNDFVLCVVEALALLVLARADLDVLLDSNGNSITFDNLGGAKDADNQPIQANWGSFVPKARKATGLETKGQALLPRITGRRKSSSYFNRNGVDPVKFRRNLRKAVLQLANELIADNNPPESLQKLVVSRCQPLLDFTWGGAGFQLQPPEELIGMGILDSLSDTSSLYGVALNPVSLGYGSDNQNTDAYLNLCRRQDRPGTEGRIFPGPGFFYNPNKGAIANKSSVEFAPVLYLRSGGPDAFDPPFAEYIRNLIPDDVYVAATFALQVAAGPAMQPQEQGWIAIRLFPQGLPDVDRFFDQLLALLKSIQAAVQGLADLITKYIEMLQSRILELQAFLNRINHIIQQLLNLFISIPPASGLVVVASGTDGVLSALVNSDNKPFDPPETIGGGVVLLAGGLPTIALELFKALFSAGGD